jgi:hypothetical protein
MSSLSYTVTTRLVNDILNDSSIQIPEHQRPEMWKKPRQERLIQTVMTRLLMPPLLFREEIEDGRRIRWLEDGQQRFISLRKFYNNQIHWDGRTFEQLTDQERMRFLSYSLPVMTFESATKEETIIIFDIFQNGVPLTPGQRCHAQQHTKLVKYATTRILKQGTTFYTRACAVWGTHDAAKDTKTKTYLMNAMAIVGGLVLGPEYITTSYDILGPHLNKDFDEEAIDSLLDTLLKVYERADEALTIPMAEKKKQWDVGRFTGYILWTLVQGYFSSNEEFLEKWSEFLVSYRRNSVRLVELHANKPASRSWTSDRWYQGVKNIFEVPPTAEEILRRQEQEQETESDEVYDE